MRRGTCARLGGALALAVATIAAGITPAGAQKGDAKTLTLVGLYETRGDSAQAIPNFDDGARLAIEELEKKGWNISYERIPTSATSASNAEQSFVAAVGKAPDAILGPISSGVIVPLGAKLAAEGIPMSLLASPPEALRDGPAGGDNLFLVRPLNDQVAIEATKFACKDLGKKKVAIVAVTTAFGTVGRDRTRAQAPKSGCEVVTVQSNAPNATDLTQQILQIKDSGADVVLNYNFPSPTGVLVNQMRQNGLTIPVVGPAIALAVSSGAVTDPTGMYGADDCVPILQRGKKAKRFVKAYEAEYGYEPNYASAQTYDSVYMWADALTRAGAHDPAKLTAAFAKTNYSGVCDYRVDRNNGMSQSVTFYTWKPDKTLQREKVATLPFLSAESVVPTTALAGS